MTRRNRIFIGILLAYALGVALLMYRQLADIDPRYRESAEESLVETAQLLAVLVEGESRDGALRTESLGPLFRAVHARRFTADIFGFEKTRVELRLTVVDRTGRVVFDSTNLHLGADHSRWRDVSLALQGQYGARTSPDVDGDPKTSVMFVSAPVRDTSAGGDAIIGAVSVGKPVQSFGQFIEAARRKTLLVGATSVVAVLLLAVILSVWLVRPFGVVGDYVRYVRAQRSLSLPRLGRRALGAFGAAFDEMRDALAGRNYVADYVQTLTHEVKGPLSAIRGAAELLQEPMADADRARFVANIARETQRIQELVDRMMELTALESRRALDAPVPVELRGLLAELAA
ncbi:MAG: two-component system sensor histidine kinase CreC, partial [Rhizobiales bacterium]|nr:two-component system sensor histidine kinase CreC [Rhizobacter sp.]